MLCILNMHLLCLAGAPRAVLKKPLQTSSVSNKSLVTQKQQTGPDSQAGKQSHPASDSQHIKLEGKTSVPAITAQTSNQTAASSANLTTAASSANLTTATEVKAMVAARAAVIKPKALGERGGWDCLLLMGRLCSNDRQCLLSAAAVLPRMHFINTVTAGIPTTQHLRGVASQLRAHDVH